MRKWGALRASTVVGIAFVLSAGVWTGGGLERKASAAPAQKQKQGVPLQAADVQQFLDTFMAQPDIRDHLAGAVATVVQGDKVLASEGYGYADVARKIVVDPEKTVFRIASVSKVVTATAVMQLTEQGQLDLNADLNRYLGKVHIPNKTGTPLTMRDLLTNSTGFEYGDTSEMSTNDLEEEFPLKSFVQSHVPTVIREPGKYYRYDNLGFTIQGYAVEQVSGQPFEQYVRDHIYKPLGMTSSEFRLTPRMMERLAVPYNVEGEPIPAYTTIPTVLPAGGMLSTGADMARFMMAHLGGGKLGEAVILKEETAAEMHKPQLAIHPKLPNMAYGFEYSNQQIYNGYNVAEKSGDESGFHSGMWLLPDEKVGVYLNVNKDFDFRTPFFEAFMDRYFPEKTETVPLGKTGQSSDSASVSPSLTAFEGVYSDLRNRMWTTRVRAEDGLLIAADPLGEHKLREIEPLLFQDENGVRAAFALNDDGSVRAFYYDLKSDSWAQKRSEPRIYPDIAADDPYASNIYHLRQLGVIGQEGLDEPFHPKQAVTRGEFVEWFIRWSGIAPSVQKPVFSDIAGSPYKQEIQAAYEFGVIKGSGSGKFEPLKPITRAEAAAVVWNLASAYLHAAPLEARIEGRIAPWAAEGVRYVVAKGLYGLDVTRSEDGAVQYRPNDPMLREEAAALLSKFADRLY
ncbi:serine hydrolase [Paenibacillus kobensis]|uniref:serine hydrolase n=1 Tax=Paenibacillus kobensis TaxID=59841 RepID=UPI000FD87CDE|nr:serine hydrolase [Paenibacillus kobensis]